MNTYEKPTMEIVKFKQDVITASGGDGKVCDDVCVKVCICENVCTKICDEVVVCTTICAEVCSVVK